MKPLQILAALVLWGFFAGEAFAQRPGAAVQLPTFSYFSTGTTVTVPDRGRAYLGGVSRAATGRNEFGLPMLPLRPFRNSGIGREMSASGVHVTATIHDFEAIDQYLLSQPTAFSRSLGSGRPRTALAAGRRPRAGNPTYGASWNKSAVAQAARHSAASVAEARAARVRQQRQRGAEAAEFFRQGRKAEAAGKMGAARIFYQMAARRATGELKQQVAHRLAAVARPPDTSKIAHNRP